MTEVDFFDDPANEPEEADPINESELNEKLRAAYDAATPEERGEAEDGEV